MARSVVERRRGHTALAVATVAVLTLAACVGAFDAAEHKHMGDSAFMRQAGRIREMCPGILSDVPAAGPSGGEAVRVQGVPSLTFDSGAQVTYGDMVALAGDYYAKSSPLSLVEGRDNQRKAVNEQFAELAKDSSLNKLLGKLMGMVQEEIAGLEKFRLKLRKCLKDVPDSWVCKVFGRCAQARAACVDEFRPKAFYDGTTLLDNLATSIRSDHRLLANALVNYDHFGGYAIKAYQLVHREALAAAATAAGLAGDGRCEALRTALGISAFSAHYLSDLFSSGHVRTPRLDLEVKCSTALNMVPLAALNLHHYIGSYPTKHMHDEDCLNGLNVANGRGDRWQMFGDGMYFDPKNDRNREISHAALAASIGEVLDVAGGGLAVGGTRLAVEDYAALPYIVTLRNSNGPEDAFAMSNPYPLYFLMNGVVYRRPDTEHPYMGLQAGEMPKVNMYSTEYMMADCHPLRDGSSTQVDLRPTPTLAEAESRRKGFNKKFLTGEDGAHTVRAHPQLDFLSVTPSARTSRMTVSVRTCPKSSTWLRRLSVSVRLFNGSQEPGEVGDPVEVGAPQVFSQTRWLNLHSDEHNPFRQGDTDVFQNIQAAPLGGTLTRCEVMLTNKHWFVRWCPGALSVEVPYEHGFKRFVCDFGCQCMDTKGQRIGADAAPDLGAGDLSRATYGDAYAVPADFGDPAAAKGVGGYADAVAAAARDRRSS